MARKAWVIEVKYTIFSINDSRQPYIDNMRSTLRDWEDVGNLAVDGSDEELLNTRAGRYNINFLDEYPAPKVGQIGIWMGVLSALEYAPIVTLEDDAILHRNFIKEFEGRLKHVPDDCDFFSLFLPRDSNHLYSKDLAVNAFITKTYQRYGGVSMYYTEQGAQKIKNLIDRDGIQGQYDDILYRYSSAGELNGYCSKPKYSDLVCISGLEQSLVQESEVWNAG